MVAARGLRRQDADRFLEAPLKASLIGEDLQPSPASSYTCRVAVELFPQQTESSGGIPATLNYLNEPIPVLGFES